MEKRVVITGYEAPAVLGTFEARDVLGTADGLCGGSVCAV